MPLFCNYGMLTINVRQLFQVVMTDIESGVNINTMFGATDEEVADTVDKVVCVCVCVQFGTLVQEMKNVSS